MAQTEMQTPNRIQMPLPVREVWSDAATDAFAD